MSACRPVINPAELEWQKIIMCFADSRISLFTIRLDVKNQSLPFVLLQRGHRCLGVPSRPALHRFTHVHIPGLGNVIASTDVQFSSPCRF